MPNTTLSKVVSLTAFCFALGITALAQAKKDQPGPPVIVRKSAELLESEATTREQPAYPPLARAAKVAGVVVVEVTVDEEGNVASARAISGHPLLKDSAVVAARRWKFKPTKLEGAPVKVIGQLEFRFNLPGVVPETAPSEKSLAELEKEAREHPDSEDTHYSLGARYMQLARYNDAIVELKRAIMINPKSQAAHIKLGSAYANAGLLKEAFETFKETIRIDPEYLENDGAYLYLGLIQLKWGNYDEAVRYFTESLRISPNLYQSLLGLGTAHTLLGEYDKAIPQFNRVIELFHGQPEEADAHYWLGKVYLYAGDRRAALREYDALKRLKSDRAEQLLKEIGERK